MKKAVRQFLRGPLIGEKINLREKQGIILKETKNTRFALVTDMESGEKKEGEPK